MLCCIHESIEYMMVRDNTLVGGGVGVCVCGGGGHPVQVPVKGGRL